MLCASVIFYILITGVGVAARTILCHLTFSTKVLFLRSGEMRPKMSSFLCLAHSINLLKDDSIPL